LNTELKPQPRLYTILLGESADDRKSTAISKTTDLFSDALEGYHMCWGVGSAEGLQKVLAKGPKLILCFDEFKHFVSKCKIESSVLLPCVTTLFEQNRYESYTKKNNFAINNCYLSILAASTVQTYERTWDASFTDIGFNNRLFLVPGSGQKKYSLPPRIPEEERMMIKKSLEQILQNIGDRLELGITQSAFTMYNEWYMNLERSIYTKRLETYAMRFMSLLAINEQKNEVDESIVSKVIDLVTGS